MREPSITLQLSVEDWRAVLLSLQRHADEEVLQNTVAVRIGRARLRYIIARIREQMPAGEEA